MNSLLGPQEKRGILTEYQRNLINFGGQIKKNRTHATISFLRGSHSGVVLFVIIAFSYLALLPTGYDMRSRKITMITIEHLQLLSENVGLMKIDSYNSPRFHRLSRRVVDGKALLTLLLHDSKGG